MRSKTIQIFLKDYDQDGVKIAELSNSMAKVFVIPRNELDYVKSRIELKQPAIYMLFDDERTAVYIGECENFYHRVKDHETRKSFWQWAVICVSSNNGINKNRSISYSCRHRPRRCLHIPRSTRDRNPDGNSNC